VHGQDFDPNGRHRAAPHPQPHGTTPAPAQKPAVASPAVLVERYTRIVLSRPGDPFPLQRLAQLYRDRDGKLGALVSDLEARAAQSGPDQYAATVALGGVEKLDGRPEDAARTFEHAVELRPADPSALLALAHLLQDRGDAAAARTRYEQALGLQTVPADREQTLRTLMGLALDAKDWEGAKRAHAQIAKLNPSSHFVKGELGRELFARGEFARAVDELKDLVASAAGDNRALAPALAEHGRAQSKAHDNAAALATLRRALQVAGPEAGVRAGIYQTITEV
jgi:Flp pilus assembly protein TadD